MRPDLLVPLSSADRARVHDHLASYGPHPRALDALRAWERRDGVKVVPEHPPDAQLAAATALLRGERPGAYALEANG